MVNSVSSAATEVPKLQCGINSCFPSQMLQGSQASDAHESVSVLHHAMLSGLALHTNYSNKETYVHYMAHHLSCLQDPRWLLLHLAMRKFSSVFGSVNHVEGDTHTRAHCTPHLHTHTVLHAHKPHAKCTTFNHMCTTHFCLSSCSNTDKDINSCRFHRSDTSGLSRSLRYPLTASQLNKSQPTNLIIALSSQDQQETE